MKHKDVECTGKTAGIPGPAGIHTSATPSTLPWMRPSLSCLSDLSSTTVSAMPTCASNEQAARLILIPLAIEEAYGTWRP